MTNEEKINLIGQKIFMLSQHMDRYRTELETLRNELEQLKAQQQFNSIYVPPVQQHIIPPVQQPVIPPQQQFINPPQQQQQFIPPQKPAAKKEKKDFQLEEYIGGKLVSIIGIALLVIGLSIGVKYAIDNGWLGPLGRIILGFISGGVILGFAFFLRNKYKLFSSIILGGGISLLFFTSYAGHAFYDLYPRELAFGLMLALTAFTVLASHIYNYEVLAVIGLVGAYGIPPLLDDHSGNIHYMFMYMSILNGGILFLSFKKNWNWVTYSAYLLSWLIYATWLINSYEEERYFTTSFLFLNIFFVIFYAMFISYKVIRKEVFSQFDVLRIMSNSMIYFGLGYYLLNSKKYEDYLGLFCVGNALMHLVVAGLCHYKKTADKKVIFLILTLVFSFITIAVPVQLDGNWVTMVWFTEMALLWFMANRFSIPLYKHMAFVLSFLGMASLANDWWNFYYIRTDEISVQQSALFFNGYFLTTLYSIALLGVTRWMARNELAEKQQKDFTFRSYAVTMSIALGVISYIGVVNEIIKTGVNLYNASATKEFISGYEYTHHNDTYYAYTALWVLIYSMLFGVALDLLNKFFLKQKQLSPVFWTIRLITLVAGSSVGLIALYALKSGYHESIEANRAVSELALYFRYIYLSFVVFLLVSMHYSSRKDETLQWSRTPQLWITHAVILLLLSNELTFLITEGDYANHEERFKLAYRIGYTILWGLYSMFLIVWGFAGKKKMLRFIAITIFAITLAKLGVDAFSMSKINKLITLCSVGIIFVAVGFLYQKFKHVLLEPDKELKEKENVA